MFSPKKAGSVNNAVVLDDHYEKHLVLNCSIHDSVSEFSNLEILEA
jgi:hypothetical protein